ncbi:MAG: DUF2155 domain-containing protein [Rhodospirillales bacterium]|nr:DUF2155 domain-containing protein [Rhodospirillales bacterium]
MPKTAIIAVVWPALWIAAATPVLATPYDVAVLQGLDKVTARVSTIEAPVGEVVKFGGLEIIARHCDKRPPEETPESAAFLDIWEVREGEAAISLFRGWMFASSPALSAMEHPVYDVWVLDCKNATQAAPPAASPPAATAPQKAQQKAPKR